MLGPSSCVFGWVGATRWTFGSLLVARLGWLFRDIQGRATPAAGAPGADTLFAVSASVDCLVLVVVCTVIYTVNSNSNHQLCVVGGDQRSAVAHSKAAT
jgi:hypothetical protein